MKIILIIAMTLITTMVISGCGQPKPPLPEEIFTFVFEKPVPVQIKDLQGIQVDYCLGLLPAVYLKYRAEKDFVLKMVESMSVVPCSVTSDDKCRPTSEIDWKDIAKSLTQERLSKMPYWKPEEVVNKECFTALRFPWSHSIMFDKNSDAVYHVIEKIRE